ncbi:SWIM zinc finger family protein [Microbispora corallina]
MRSVIERWSRDQVLALVPDAASQRAAAGVSAPGKWSGAGALPGVVWGECKGSGATPYRACVDLGEPAYRCSCPSRKFPCKHALGLLLLWSADGVPQADEPTAWVAEWLDQRRARAEKKPAPPDAGASADTADDAEAVVPSGPGAGEARGGGAAAAARRSTAEQRESRVAAGLSELERWLRDQIAQGVAQTPQTGLAEWDGLARRLVDAQAPGAAGVVARLSRVLAREEWPGLLLQEYALLHLLAVAHRRAEALPGGLRDTVRSRVGFPVSRESVLASPPVRDHWDVVGSRDEEQDRLVARRVWLAGRGTGRMALVLSFAPVGQALDASLVPGTTIDADLTFYPGSSPLRALVAERYGRVAAGPPPGTKVAGIPALIAEVLAGDPWADSWPVVLADVVPSAEGLVGDEGDLLPLHPSAGAPWRLMAVSGGHPLTVAAEWTPRGLRPLATWDDEGQVVRL